MAPRLTRVPGGAHLTNIVAMVSSANTLRFDRRDRRTTDFIRAKLTPCFWNEYIGPDRIHFIGGRQNTPQPKLRG